MVRVSAFFRRSAALAVLGLLVSGCAMFEQQEETRPCPRTAMLSDAASVVVFRDGPGRDLTDVLTEGQFTNFTGTCQYDTEDDGSGQMNIELRLDMRIASGPANTARVARIPYFVSLTDAAQNVLDKQVFDAVAEFPGNRTQANLVDQPVDMTIPLAAGQNGRNFNIFIGFQLTREQLDYNRKRRGKR